MRKFLGTLVILLVIVAAVGYLRGWFNVTTQSEQDETNIELRIDKEKIKQDAAAAKEKARELTSSEDSSEPGPGNQQMDELRDEL